MGLGNRSRLYKHVAQIQCDHVARCAQRRTDVLLVDVKLSIQKYSLPRGVLEFSNSLLRDNCQTRETRDILLPAHYASLECSLRRVVISSRISTQIKLKKNRHRCMIVVVNRQKICNHITSTWAFLAWVCLHTLSPSLGLLTDLR